MSSLDGLGLRTQVGAALSEAAQALPGYPGSLHVVDDRCRVITPDYHAQLALVSKCQAPLVFLDDVQGENGSAPGGFHQGAVVVRSQVALEPYDVYHLNRPSQGLLQLTQRLATDCLAGFA